MKIGLYSKDDAFSEKCLNNFKNESGLDCIDLKADAKKDCANIFNGEKVGKLDFIVCFGGDGTTLRCVEFAAQNDIPIISVNTGSLGFLSAYTPESLNYLYDHIKNNEIEFEEKSLLNFELDGKSHIALNEVTVQRALSEYSETAKFYFSLNGKLADEFSGDGVIISTATGSTAYSLSTGAPILSPDVNAFLFSAICPHSLHARSLVFSDKDEISIEIKRISGDCNVYYDGKLAGKMQQNGEIFIKKSEKTIKLAKINDFYSRLNNKLRSW